MPPPRKASCIRNLSIRFSYNRSFSGSQPYPDAGSWTMHMRLDYTLSFWPAGITEAEAELQELIVHIHFDAKYKIDHLNKFLEPSSNAALAQEKRDNSKGIYKNADLLKMHAYKDAIRRTGGAYVLYPGHKDLTRKGFHEILPGLGAFPVRPSKTEDGTGALKAFILAIIDHFINRSSQREKWAYYTFDVFKQKPGEDNILNEPLPEPYGANRDLLPDDSFVLIGYYKFAEQLAWIRQHHLYNFRTGSGAGGLVLDAPGICCCIPPGSSSPTSCGKSLARVRRSVPGRSCWTKTILPPRNRITWSFAWRPCRSRSCTTCNGTSRTCPTMHPAGPPRFPLPPPWRSS
ncbi:nuclease domain-containing protein [Niabella aurantiaca]|uniref:nuclease domain-containing protein n=1 Tax=Niabella aurantiaca TaxID=379900 RepID=UPI00037438F2|nr:nuclease domain-containing protein [Niabella aurantiaca]